MEEGVGWWGRETELGTAEPDVAIHSFAPSISISSQNEVGLFCHIHYFSSLYLTGLHCPSSMSDIVTVCYRSYY